MEQVPGTRTHVQGWQCPSCQKLFINRIVVAPDATALSDQNWIQCPSCSGGGWLSVKSGERVVSIVVNPAIRPVAP